MMKKVLPCLFALWSLHGHAQIEYVSVTSYGEGINEADAIKVAQIQAIGQVSGELLAAHTAIDKKSVETNSGAARSRTISKSTESLVKGVVKSTKIVRVGPNPRTGLFEAEIVAEIAKIGQSEQLKRRRIAVVASESAQDGSIMESLRSSLESNLVASRKMAVLDRRDSSAIESELQIAHSGRAPIEDRLKGMELPTADLMGVVRFLTLREMMDPLGQAMTELVVKIAVLDVSSRQVKFQKDIKTFYPGKPAASGLAIGKIAGERIAREVLDYAFPIMVVSDGDGVTVVSGGSAQLRVGNEVTFYKLGKPIIDPYTGEVVGQDEVEAGTGQVISIQPAIARIKSKGFSWQPGTEYVVKLSGSKAGPAKKAVTDADW